MCRTIWGKSPWRATSNVRKRHVRRQRTMRKSKLETAKTRERIVKAAGAEFAANGISEAALARVMAAAGLTHGGFYRHFASKDQLVLEACSKTLLSLVASLELLINGKPHEQALPFLVDHYVSRAHRDQPRTGCPLAALGSELARRDKRTRHAAMEGFLQLSRLIDESSCLSSRVRSPERPE